MYCSKEMQEQFPSGSLARKKQGLKYPLEGPFERRKPTRPALRFRYSA